MLGRPSASRSSALRSSLVNANDENSFSTKAGLNNNKNKNSSSSNGNNGSTLSTKNKKPSVRMALSSKTLDGSNNNNGNAGSKTPGPSSSRRRALGDISNRKAARANAGGNGGIKSSNNNSKISTKSVSFQKNVQTPGRRVTANKSKSAAKKFPALTTTTAQHQQQQQHQQQCTPFSVRNDNRDNVAGSNSNARKKTPRPRHRRTNAVLPNMNQLQNDDDGGGDISDVELPAVGGVWDPSDYFQDDAGGRERRGSFEYYRVVQDDIKAYKNNCRLRTQRALEEELEDDALQSDALEEDYEAIDNLLLDGVEDDLCNDLMLLRPPTESERHDEFAI